MRTLRTLCWTLLLPFILLAEGRGMWANMTKPVPVDRLVKNANAYVKEHPNEAHGFYVLGRLHSLAFAKKTDTLHVIQKKEGKPIGFAPWESIMIKRTWKPKELTEQIKTHLKEAVRNYQKAVELSPKDGKTWLGLGWVHEEAGRLAIPVTEKKEPKELTDEERAKYEELVSELGAESADRRDTAKRKLESEIWKALPVLLDARDHKDLEVRARVRSMLGLYRNREAGRSALGAYRKAYALTVKGDLKAPAFGPGKDYAISLEAGKGIVRILKDNAKTREELKDVRAAIKKIQAKPRAITPIVFSLEQNVPLESLLARDKRVSFDLDGDGEPGLWPWVKPQTGILVWDPAGTGKIESGIQMFGSVTWWISWEHGYQPLDLLDDDRDGWLSGRELRGLAVWRDRNGNAVSDPGEVIPAQTAGIDRIAVHPAGRHAGVPSHATGLRLRDGSILPTYDWTPMSVPPR